MSRRSIVIAGLVLAAVTLPAAAQMQGASQKQPVAVPVPLTAPASATSARNADRAAVADSLRVEIGPELQRSLDELAATLDRLGRRVANDPELRASAVKAAQGFVGVAQVMVVQQADVLQEVLKSAAERLAEVAPPAQPSTPATPRR